jgi:2-polyprenyl-3-methyl-5-hydroxy-6-metoxy-1,4-benzoquinol methylase
MTERTRQLAYSETQGLMLDEEHRRNKAAKIIAVLEHFLGVDDLTGLVALDIGCSGGTVSAALNTAGAHVVGVDIDEPGLRTAASRYGDHIEFVRADSEQSPFRDSSVDIVVCNHIYEHVVDPQALIDEIARLLKPSGAAYLGFANRLGVIEPHYRLPFLSWLPKPLAHRYIRASGRADEYYETFRTRPGLRRLCHALDVWDYTLPVLMDRDRFAATDIIPSWAHRIPTRLFQMLMPLVPTYVWIGTVDGSTPRGDTLAVPPQRVST